MFYKKKAETPTLGSDGCTHSVNINLSESSCQMVQPCYSWSLMAMVVGYTVFFLRKQESVYCMIKIPVGKPSE